MAAELVGTVRNRMPRRGNSYSSACSAVFYASAYFFEWRFPHDGQNGLGVLAVGITVLVTAPIPTAIVLYALQRFVVRVQL
jgi:hypothetical protein